MPVQQARRLMLDFADRTGVSRGSSGQRYLWTDAFAVMNFLELARLTGEPRFTELALSLIDDVHHVLGRYRPDDARRGWLCGLSEAEGEAHPTRGGLRIGKPLPERGPDEPFDDELEWERDGQYFHYSTRWMHALEQATRATGDLRFRRWARELAVASFAGFAYANRSGGPPRLAWKMSTDLARPLVASMGHHDPLDGFITCAVLQAGGDDGPSLQRELHGFASMLGNADWATPDPLGIGGLLMDACRVAQVTGRSAVGGDALLGTLLAAALESLRLAEIERELDRPAVRRIAFRELGLAIGLSGLAPIERELSGEPARFAHRETIEALLGALAREARLAAKIVSFWLVPEHRSTAVYRGHRDINDVMLATSLCPLGVVALLPMDRPAVRIEHSTH